MVKNNITNPSFVEKNSKAIFKLIDSEMNNYFLDFFILWNFLIKNFGRICTYIGISFLKEIAKITSPTCLLPNIQKLFSNSAESNGWSTRWISQVVAIYRAAKIYQSSDMRNFFQIWRIGTLSALMWKKIKWKQINVFVLHNTYVFYSISLLI